MSRLEAASLRVVVYEGKGSEALPPADRAALVRSLLDGGYAVDSLRADGPVPEPLANGMVVILGRFVDGPPPNGSDAGGSRVRFQDLQGLDAAAAIARVRALGEEAEIAKPGGWKPWFPVIDYQRCTNCMQCLSFCLFDVYGASVEGKIEVRNQDNCKTDCPACSRVCPEVAILFPKYRHGPINGDEVRADDIRREAMKTDISALLGGDIYAMLRDRSEKARSRFSKERDEERALKERQTCMVKLQRERGMEIPAEVLAALPSPEEIRSRAAAAQAKAEEALEAAARSGLRPAAKGAAP